MVKYRCIDRAHQIQFDYDSPTRLQPGDSVMNKVAHYRVTRTGPIDAVTGPSQTGPILAYVVQVS